MGYLAFIFNCTQTDEMGRLVILVWGVREKARRRIRECVVQEEADLFDQRLNIIAPCCVFWWNLLESHWVGWLKQWKERETTWERERHVKLKSHIYSVIGIHDSRANSLFEEVLACVCVCARWVFLACVCQGKSCDHQGGRQGSCLL